jgi:UrcA family protein
MKPVPVIAQVARIARAARVGQVAVSRPNVTLLMILCGAVSAAAAGAVSAATVADEVPRLIVRYQPDSLESEAGARSLYHRLVRAAEEVCPAGLVDHPFLSSGVRHCREQAVARAVQEIGNTRLAAVHAASTRSG